MTDFQPDPSYLDIEKQQLIDLKPSSSSVISYNKTTPSVVKWKRVSRKPRFVVQPPPPVKPMKPWQIAILTIFAVASVVVMIVTIVLFEQSCKSRTVKIPYTDVETNADDRNTPTNDERMERWERLHEYWSQNRLRPSNGAKGASVLTKCQSMRMSNSRASVGHFVPQCDSNGDFEPRQCRGSTGYCWCVNKDGEEMTGTRRGPTEDRVDCYEESTTTEVILTKCQSMQMANSRASVGHFVPQCDSNGDFEPSQCHGSTGYCWCVNKDGEETPGTRRGPTEDRVDCYEESTTTEVILTKCQSMQMPNSRASVGHFVPQCDSNGDFEPSQCHGSTGYCWCVNKDGEETPGTRRGPTEDRVDCYEESTTTEVIFTKCQSMQMANSGASFKHFVPQCDSNGDFEPNQCHGSTGYCWCVNKDGDETPGTRRGPAEDKVDCVSGRERRMAEELLKNQVITMRHNGEQKLLWESTSKESSWEALGEICGKPVGGSSNHDGVNIVNGEDVNDIRRWPWAAYLGNPSSSFYCGAELITSQWVLTAAHCVTDQYQVTVTLGTTTRKYKSPSATKISASRGIIHPYYNSNTMDYDVALLKLSQPVRISDYIRPVCLANSTNETRVYKSGSCWKIGWGRTGGGLFSSTSDILQQINAELISPENCRYYYFGSVSESMICSSDSGWKGACTGDSGGPTMCKNLQGTWDLVGITSWGVSDCGNPQYADVMARVSIAHDWIVKTISSNGGPGDIIGH